MIRLLGRIGRPVVGAARDAGGMTMIIVRACRSLVPWDVDRDEFRRALFQFGYLSLPVVIATAFFAGGIMVLQAALYIARYGAYSLVGWGAGFVTLREMGPLLIGLMFSGRVGANNTAELATMTTTEQIDALRVLAIDPFRYLVVPRLLAMVITLFCLTSIGLAVSIMGGAVVAKMVLALDFQLYFRSLFDLIRLSDLGCGLLKALGFGLIIGAVSTHFGLSVTGGATGVGRAVNASVVASAIALFVVDYFMTAALA